MTRSLHARVAKLEEAAGVGGLPNGGLVIVIVPNGSDEAVRAAALKEKLREPEFTTLTAVQRRKIIPVFVTPECAAVV